MSKVYPFHGFRYNPDKVDLNKVVTQPYDKIDSSLQDKYYQADPYNIVRIILGKDEGNKNKYENAANYLKKWLEKEIILQDKEPAFYAYLQEYKIKGKVRIRKGFVGLGGLEGEENVKAHEDTLEGPKADRLNLIRATEANFGHIFMLYSDPENKIINIIDQQIANKEAIVKVNDEDGNKHLLWKITDKQAINKIKEYMEDKKLYIADGHHRYQTALNYQSECKQKAWKSLDPEGYNSRLMTFININDPDLVILPTHRLIYGIKDFNHKEFLIKASKHFHIAELESKEELYNKLSQAQGINSTIAYKAKDDNFFYTLTLKAETNITQLINNHFEAFCKLDVAILHKCILEKYLGIDEKALAEKKNIDYIRYSEQALKTLEKEDKYQACFILNPTRVEEVKNIADQGLRMPQKSTDFYPKLLTGLVFNKLKIDKG